MAGLGQEAVVPIRPDLATNLQPLQLGVQQSAVALMAESFRAGQISYDDIAARYGALAKGKEKMQIQGIDEFLNPAAIATRQNQQAALNTEAILKSSPEYIAAQEATTQALFNKANEGDSGAKQEYSRKLGFFDGFDPAVGWNAEQRTRTDTAFEKARAFTDYQNQAKAILADAELRKDDIKSNERVLNSTTGEMEDVETVRPRTDKELYSTSKTTGHKIDEDELRAARRAALLTPAAWERSGMPGSPFGEVPGKVAPAVTGRSTTTVTKNKVTVDADGKRTEETSETKTVPEGATESPAPAALPAVSIKRTAVPIDAGKKLTDVQGRALFALSGANNAERSYAALEAKGYNVTDWTATGWEIANKLPVPEAVLNQFKSGERQQFEQAITSFDEGFLRLLSGAAISVGEHKTYRRMFWPMPGDSAGIVGEKKQLRAQAAGSAAQMLESGGSFAAGSVGQKAVQETLDRALAIEKGYGGAATSTQAGRPTISGSQKIIDLPGVGKGYYDATTKKFHKVVE